MEICLLACGSAAAILAMLGSNNGVGHMRYGLYLLLPAVLLLLPSSLRRVDSLLRRVASSDRRERIRQKPMGQRTVILVLLPVVLVLCFAVIGGKIRYESAYRDSSQRMLLRFPVDGAQLAGILTTEGRANSVGEMLAVLSPLVESGQVILAYNSIALVHYLTETIPLLGTPWPILKTASELERMLGDLDETEKPELVVRALTNTRRSAWGTRFLQDTNSDILRELAVLDAWVAAQGFRAVWSNRDFRILLRVNEHPA